MPMQTLRLPIIFCCCSSPTSTATSNLFFSSKSRTPTFLGTKIYVMILVYLSTSCPRRLTLVSLVKPQFEAHRTQVGGGGIVRDPLVHKEVLEKIIKRVKMFGIHSNGWIESPLNGAEGNTEFRVCFSWTAEKQAEQ